MYKCQVPDCGRAFIQLSNLQQHLRSHVSQSERLKNRPFHCAICDRGFATESSMRTHNSKVCTTVNKNKNKVDGRASPTEICDFANVVANLTTG